MRLTWRDGVTTLLAISVAGAYAWHAAGWQLAVVDDARGATLLIGIAGLSMCIAAGSGVLIGSRNAWNVPLGVLGVASLAIIVVGVVTGWELAVPAIAAMTLLMWAISTVRHAVEPRTPQRA